jgi:xanthine dehydrogenase accessory factor
MPFNRFQDPSELATLVDAMLAQPVLALAWVTLVERSGSSYRQPGAQLLIRADGTWQGSISGGCLEGDLLERARQMERVEQDHAIEVVDTRPVFGCHGTITLFIERLQPILATRLETLKRVQLALRQRQPFSMETHYGGENPRGVRLVNGPTHGMSPEGKCLFQNYGRRKRLLVIGAHRDVQPLLHMSQLLGWECLQVVPGAQRTAWVDTGEAGVDVLHTHPAALPDCVPPDPDTAVVVMTHNIARDAHYLHHLLPLPYGYVGALGSQKRRSELTFTLTEDGSAAMLAAIEKLHCPIGLDVGAETQEGIALSILAEVQAVLNGRNGGHLRDSAGPIHP